MVAATDLVKKFAGYLNRLAGGEKKTSEGVAPELFGLTGDYEDPRYQRLTSPNTIRDLNPMMHLRMQEIAFYLKSTTPFGKRIVEVITSYVVGEGFKASAADANVQAVIDKFWTDEINNMAEGLRDHCDEETTFGELCLPVTVNPVDGFVRMGYVDPHRIESVEYGTIAGPNGTMDTAFPVAVHLRKRANDPARRLTIIRTDEDPNSATFGQLTGECFYFAINKAKGASRGLSELFALADWIDVFDQMVFDFADKVRFLNSFVWHYTLTGGDPKQVDEFRKKVTMNPPRQGGVQVTNEQVKIEAQTPELNGADMSEAVRTVKLYGLGGAGLPAWFFADPIDANKSTAEEMTGPTGKKLTDRQNHLRAAVIKILTFVVQQAIYHGVLPMGVDTTIALQCPDLMIKDLQKASMTLGAVVNAVGIMEENGWIKGETAARASHVVLSQIGVEVDSKKEYEEAQKEKQDRDAKAQELQPDQSSLAKALTQIEQGDGPPKKATATQ